MWFRALRARYGALQSDHRAIAIGMAWVALFVVAGKFAGAAKEMAVAWRYGVSETVDAYQLASTLVFWLPGTLVSVLTIVLVPMLVRLRQENTDVRTLFLRELQGSVVVIGVIMCLISLLLGQIALPYFAGNTAASTRQMTWDFTLGMAPLAVLALMLGVYSARLMAQQRQINTLLEGIPAVAVLVFVLSWPVGDAIEPLLWGTALGLIAQTVWTWRLAWRADGAKVMPRFSLRSPHWPELYKSVSVMAAGQFVMSFITPLDQYTAAQLGDGAVATLGYANRVTALLLGIGAIAVARAALPVLANLQAAGQPIQARIVALKWAALMLGMGTLVALFAWGLAPWGIKLLFERGAFTAENTWLVVEVFRWGLIQMPFFFSGLVLVQLLATQSRYRTIALFATANLAIKFALNWIFATWLGISGIALATGLMYAFSASCLFYSVWSSRRA